MRKGNADVSIAISESFISFFFYLNFFPHFQWYELIVFFHGMQGLNPLMFVFALVGNAAYVAR